MLDGEARDAEAQALYRRAAKAKPLDATEHLGVARVQAALRI
jgi:hypothetical protein